MTQPRFIISQSIVWIVLALVLLIAPAQGLAFFGMEAGPSAVLVARILGSELVGLAAASFVARDPQKDRVRRGLALSYIACNSLGVLTTLTATLSGAMSSTGWIAVGMYGIYAGGFLILLLRPR